MPAPERHGTMPYKSPNTLGHSHRLRSSRDSSSDMPPEKTTEPRSVTNHPVTGTKRSSGDLETEHNATKRQKSRSMDEGWKNAEAKLKSLHTELCGLRGDIEAFHTSDEKKITELRGELATRKKEIEDLAENYKCLQSYAVKDRMMLRNFQEQHKATVKVKENTEARLKALQGEHGKLAADLGHTQSMFNEMKHERDELFEAASKKNGSKEEYQGLLDAVEMVRAMTSGMPVQNMGPMGKALEKMDEAFLALDPALR